VTFDPYATAAAQIFAYTIIIYIMYKYYFFYSLLFIYINAYDIIITSERLRIRSLIMYVLHARTTKFDLENSVLLCVYNAVFFFIILINALFFAV